MKSLTLPHNPLQKWVELSFALLFGGVVYYLLELLFRGWSHWSMAICGAICFGFLYRLNATQRRMPLLLRAAIGSAFITGVELIAGLILNVGLGMCVWDYSTLPFHFLGQISLFYSFLWFLLCFPASGITGWIRRHVFLYEF